MNCVHSFGFCFFFFTVVGDFQLQFVLLAATGCGLGLDVASRYRGPKTCSLIPKEIRDSESLSIFRNKIKQWKPVGCTCKLCWEYREGIGYGIQKGDVFILKEAQT